MTYKELIKLLPEGTARVVVEERQHRGNPVFAVVAIVPDGASIVINGYYNKDIAETTRDLLASSLS